MSRLSCILTLALLCLPVGTQATPVAPTIASAPVDMSKATLTLGPGTENWQVKEFLNDSRSGVRVGDQSVGKFATHLSVAVSNEPGRRGDEASSDNGHLNGSAFTETVDLHSGLRPTTKAGASGHKSFLVSGEGHGATTFSAPATQDGARSMPMIVDRQGTSLPTNNGFAVVSLFDANDREQHAALASGRNGVSPLHRTQAGTLALSEFLSPKRALGDFGVGLASDVRGVSLPEPSSMIFLSCALLALVIFPRRIRR
jgi:hypothetical protein